MAKEIQYSRISTKLQNLKAAHPQDVSAKLWNETFKDLINGGESMRLFDVFSGSLGLLEARNKRYMKWSSKANSSNWTSNWVQSLFEKYNIVSKFGPSTDASGKMVHPRTKRTESPEQKLPEYAKLPVSPDQLTDAELDTAIQEIQATLNAFVSEKNKRAEIVAKKHELFKTVTELIEGEGFTLDEIMQIV